MKSNYSELNDSEWLAERYESGMDHTDIAETVGCAPRTVIDWTCHHGLTQCLPAQAQTESDVVTREWLEQQIDEHDSLNAIAEGTPHTSYTVSRWAIRYGCDEPDGSDDDNTGIDGLPDEGEWPDHAKTGQPWQDEAQLRRAYHEYLWSPSDIGKWCDVSPGLIRSEMERKGIGLRDTGTAIRLHNMRENGMSLAHRKAVVRGFGEDSDGETNEPDDTTVEWSRLAADD